jgi:hypothetical protein
VNPNNTRRDQWLVWVVVAAILLYSLAVGLGLMVRAMNGGGTEWAFPLMAIPCFVTAVWYAYTYLSVRPADRDGGLIVSGIGWAAVGIAFLLKRDVAQAVNARSAPNFWWSVVAMVLIIGGAAVSISGRWRPRPASQPPQESVESPSHQPSEQKKE